MSTLAELAELVRAEVLAVPGVGSPEVTDVVADSRRVHAGSMFCCVPGERHDGHDHAAAAVEAGAVALLCERRLPLDVPQLLVADVRAAMAPVAARVHGDPSGSIDVVGVTGTNGKTTVVSMIASVLGAAGRNARTIGTLTGARTTPEAPDLQRQLAEFVADGVEAVAMEVSSHALALHRVDAVHFAVAVFTNLGVDHLDFHGTPEAYFSAKARLFEPGRARIGVVNTDDIRGRLLVDAADGPMVPVGLADAVDLRAERDGMHLLWRGVPLHVPLHGRHNVENALLAAEACRALGIDEEVIAAGLAALPVVPGRFETFSLPSGATVVVDYAHTPDALEQVLAASRDLAGDRGRVTAVFGCGGDRDRSKRPLMGEVAARLADRVIVTTDNPRSEDPDTIIAEVVAGADGPVEVVGDRSAAIRAALVGLGADDVVLVAGKGHEQGQVFADRTIPFDDRDEVRSAIAAIGGDARVIRLLLAVGIATVVSLIGTKVLIVLLTRRKIGQPIHEDVPEGHMVKAGTPTMGGVAIVAGALAGYLVSNLYDGVFTWTGIASMVAIAGAGVVGLFDDWLKVAKERNLGLNKRAKMIGLLLVALVFVVLMLTRTNVHTTISFTVWYDLGWDLGEIGWAIWAILLISGTSNAVNLTDGLDGLAAGAAALVFAGYVVIGYSIFRYSGFFGINVGLDLAVVAAAMMGACAGFLWWNAAPAQIFMGDTGSLAIGTGLAALALSSSTALLLPILGLVFVVETVSVILQVASFRLFGRRIFRMAPIHHHFELMGWPETTVIIRMWMVTGACTAFGLGLFYREFIRGGGLG